MALDRTGRSQDGPSAREKDCCGAAGPARRGVDRRRLSRERGSAVVLSGERDGKVGALKLIDPEMLERYGLAQQLTRIERERELIGHTEPHLVKIFDGGQCPDTQYLYVVMELIPHPALTTMITMFPRSVLAP